MSRHDISDEKWAIIGPMLVKPRTETRGRKRKDDRLMFNAILWLMKTGASCGTYIQSSGPGKRYINASSNGLNLKSGMTFFECYP